MLIHVMYQYHIDIENLRKYVQIANLLFHGIFEIPTAIIKINSIIKLL